MVFSQDKDFINGEFFLGLLIQIHPSNTTTLQSMPSSMAIYNSPNTLNSKKMDKIKIFNHNSCELYYHLRSVGACELSTKQNFTIDFGKEKKKLKKYNINSCICICILYLLRFPTKQVDINK